MQGSSYEEMFSPKWASYITYRYKDSGKSTPGAKSILDMSCTLWQINLTKVITFPFISLSPEINRIESKLRQHIYEHIKRDPKCQHE